MQRVLLADDSVAARKSIEQVLEMAGIEVVSVGNGDLALARLDDVRPHMVLLDAYSGVVRGKTKTVLNPEDGQTVAKGSDVVKQDPDAVARVLRAHRNLTANGVPFLIMGLVWVLLGASFPWIAGGREVSP